MAEETQYTANTGMAQVSTANSNLDGTGTLSTVLTAGSNGTLVKSVRFLGTGTNQEGMLRLFIYDGTNTRLIQEVHVPANTPSATNPAFEYIWNCELPLQSGYILKASTQNAETFNIIAEGLNWTYFSGAVRPESTNYTANTGTAVVSTANSNLDGTGTLATVVTAGSSSTYKGCRVEEISIQAIVTTTMGMVRLFLYDGTNTRLFKEIPIPAVTKSATERAFSTKIALGNFNLQAGWSIKAATQNAESFAIVAECNDWKYPANTYVTNYTPTSGTAVTTEELLHSLQVPANVVSAGDLLHVYSSLLITNNANNKTFRIYINTSNTLTAATLLSTFTTTGSSTDVFSRYYPVISDTSLENYAGTTTSVRHQYNPSAGNSDVVTVPSVSGGFWILISGQKANAADTDTIRWSMVERVF